MSATGTSSTPVAACCAGDKPSTSSFSRIGTETVASFAATRHASAKITRPLWAHR